MNLMQLSAAANDATGKSVGFVVKSLKNPERKYLVGYMSPITGKFIITRLDTKEDFVVAADADRYELVVSLARLKAVKSEIKELTERQVEINERLSELQVECGELSDINVG